MRLLCKKYQWDSGTDTNDVNFYSSAVPSLIETIDLYDYLVKDSLSPFGYDPEAVDSENNLVIKASNVSFRLKNDISEIARVTKLQDFFEIYNVNDYIKFRFEFYEDDSAEMTFRGIIYKDGVTFNERSNDIIDATVLGYEKEFKDYYINQTLGSPDLWTGSTGSGGNPIEINGFKFFNLSYALRQIFPNIDFAFSYDLTNFINKYYLAEKPFTYAADDPSDSTWFEELENFLHVKTGYSCYYLDGINKYDWFDSLLSSKGWVWYFKNGQMIIKQRAANEITDTTTIDFAEVGIEDSIKTEIVTNSFDTVIMENGRYFDNDNPNTGDLRNAGLLIGFDIATGKARDVSCSSRMVVSSNTYSNNQIPFRNFWKQGSNDYTIGGFPTHNYMDYAGQQGSSHQFKKVSMTLSAGTGDQYSFSESSYSYNTGKTLTINPVINSVNNSGGVDRRNPRADTGAYYGQGNFFYAANQVNTNGHIYYNGNPGSSVFKYEANTNKYINYETECKRQQFKDNFKPLLKGSNNYRIIFEMEVKQLITDPAQNIIIDNYPYKDLSGKIFSIQKLSFDYINKTSQLTLLMLN